MPAFDGISNICIFAQREVCTSLFHAYNTCRTLFDGIERCVCMLCWTGIRIVSIKCFMGFKWLTVHTWAEYMNDSKHRSHCGTASICVCVWGIGGYGDVNIFGYSLCFGCLKYSSIIAHATAATEPLCASNIRITGNWTRCTQYKMPGIPVRNSTDRNRGAEVRWGRTDGISRLHWRCLFARSSMDKQNIRSSSSLLVLLTRIHLIF